MTRLGVCLFVRDVRVPPAMRLSGPNSGNRAHITAQNTLNGNTQSPTVVIPAKAGIHLPPYALIGNPRVYSINIPANLGAICASVL